IYPPQSPTRITNNSILKLAGAFHCVKTSSIRFWAFSYSIGEPCGRSDQVSMYFISILLCWVDVIGNARVDVAPGRRGHAPNNLLKNDGFCCGAERSGAAPTSTSN